MQTDTRDSDLTSNVATFDATHDATNDATRKGRQLRFARNNNGTDRVYHAKEAANTASQCLNLLNFLLVHIPELPTDAATLAVLRQDVGKMNTAIEQARALLLHRWGPLAQ